ncbi:pyridoxamine 5'-phosphate oxidase family protein [Naasia lichenicola]|uniref:Pyridoxamine 5-phosphate oxidase n=1 Tax=Naasia lichenicola TaxID=2565933 RepID=A0A4S4FLI7_9MICO|nr:pyridoxamine 5'-phosphate oxidase family protein [Naasia lichenicola]THG30944.1 pyridoxamine 5-phosphate oxidase [Naasia lichenicola]
MSVADGVIVAAGAAPHSANVSGDALALLSEWLPSNSDPARPQIQLATVDADGRPDVRTVLLSEWSTEGFYFHTDSRSRKVADLRANPAVAIEVLWPGFSRQLVIRGFAEQASNEEEADAYARRSPYLKQLAWQNTAELAARPVAERESTWTSFASDNDIARIDAPPTWIGFLVRPDRLTFWESNPTAPSHRVEYALESGDWTEHHLPG